MLPTMVTTYHLIIPDFLFHIEVLSHGTFSFSAAFSLGLLAQLQ